MIAKFTEVAVTAEADDNQNLVQVLHLNRPPRSGSFKLTYGKKHTVSIPNDAPADKVQAALEGLENVGVGKVTVAAGKLPTNKLKISFDKSLLGKDPKLGLIATQVDFSGLFLIPCVIAIAAAVLLGLFFHPPKNGSIPESITH